MRPSFLPRNLIEAFYAQADRLGDELAIRDEGREVELNWNELREKVHRIAGGLAKLGVKKGDTVALMLGNRWEFIPSDLAAVSLGAVPFSIYQTLAPEQIQYVRLRRRRPDRDHRERLPGAVQRGAEGAARPRARDRGRRRGQATTPSTS